MIVDIVRGDILKSEHKHIAFAVNDGGINDAGFAGLVSRKFWPELEKIGPMKLGSCMELFVNGRTFYGLVCHSLGSNGWRDTPVYVQSSLDELNERNRTVFAVVMIGAGPIGQMSGADSLAIMGAMARSKKQVVVYSL